MERKEKWKVDGITVRGVRIWKDCLEVRKMRTTRSVVLGLIKDLGEIDVIVRERHL